MTLSSPSGPSGGGNPITATATASAANPVPFPAGQIPTVQFQYSGPGATICNSKTKAVTPIAATGTNTTAVVLTVDPADVQQISTTKIAFEVPSAAYPAQVDGQASEVNKTGLALQTGQTSSKWNVCVYDSPSTTTSTLLATSTYTLYVRPRITRTLPDSSPAAGGQTITVTGVGFATGLSAMVGGSPVGGIKVASNGLSFTGNTPVHAPGINLPLVVNTQGGQVISTDPDNNGKPQDSDNDTADAPLYFTYSNGITITPNNAPAGGKVSVAIKGVGFSSLSFNKGSAGTPTDSKAHVFLVRDAYNAATNRGVHECKNVLVISDVEIVCTLDLGADRLNPADSAAVPNAKVTEGTYTLTVVATGAADATAEAAAATVVSTGSTFIVAPY